MTRTLTEDERALMQHVTMWGSDGYPVRKLGRKWIWGEWRSVKGPPTVFRTKRAAVESFERYLDFLRMILGEEAGERARTEQEWHRAQVSCLHEGRTLLGDVWGVATDRATGRPVLQVHHFNGEPWPINPTPDRVTDLRAVSS